MAILQTDSDGVALTDNSGKPLVLTSGSVLQVAMATSNTPVSQFVPSTPTWIPTNIQISLTSRAQNSKFLVHVSTSSFSNYNIARMYYDLWGTLNNGSIDSITGVGGGNWGLAGGSMYYRADGGTVIGSPPNAGASFSFFHAPNRPSGSTITFRVYGKSDNTSNTVYYGGDPNRTMLSTITVQEIV